MGKNAKRKFVAPELLSVSAGPDGTSLNALFENNGSNDQAGCNANGIIALFSCFQSGNSAAFNCEGAGIANP